LQNKQENDKIKKFSKSISNTRMEMATPLIYILLILIIWDMVWRGIALWKAGRNGQLSWFIAILIFNTIGILPILYIAFFQKNQGR
jgi:hypothetical protein